MNENVFDLIAQIAIADGDSPITKFPGCWHRKLDDEWEIWVNGHREKMAIPRHEELKVSPFHCYVEFNGWPAGVFTPFDGCIVAGKLANEETFIKALKNALNDSLAAKEHHP